MNSIDIVVTDKQMTQGITISSTITVAADDGLSECHTVEFVVRSRAVSKLDDIGDKATIEFRHEHPDE